MSSPGEDKDVPAWISQLTALAASHKTAVTRTSYKSGVDNMEGRIHHRAFFESLLRFRLASSFSIY